MLAEAKSKGIQVVQNLEEQLSHGGAVHTYLTDQIVIFMALATSGYKQSSSCEPCPDNGRCGVSVGKVSLHTTTAIKVAERLLPDIMFSIQ